MLAHWKHLSLDDRKMIGNMIGHDAKAKTIAIILKMDPTAISKEMARAYYLFGCMLRLKNQIKHLTRILFLL
jgi:IS30 family transposase